MKPSRACHGGNIANRTTPWAVVAWSSTPRVTYSAAPVITLATAGQRNAKLDIRG